MARNYALPIVFSLTEDSNLLDELWNKADQIWHQIEGGEPRIQSVTQAFFIIFVEDPVWLFEVWGGLEGWDTTVSFDELALHPVPMRPMGGVTPLELRQTIDSIRSTITN